MPLMEGYELKDKAAGQITVFSAIILLSMLMLAGVLVDISRISAGRTMVKRAADSAARSLLANYGSKMKEDYGIFAIPPTAVEDLQDRLEEYMACNLSIPLDEEYYKGRTDLFGFRIERVHVTPIFNLSENNVTKQQILEYMKYRAPQELVEGFMERLSAIKDVGKMSAAYKKKVGIDKILGSMDKSQQKLKKCIDGSGSTYEKFINGFNLGGSWEAAYNSFNSLSSSLSSIKSSLDSLDSSINELEIQKSQMETEDAASTGTGIDIKSNKDDTASSSTTQTSSENEIDGRIDSLKEEKSTLQNNYSETNNQLQQIWNEIRYSLTEDYMKSNENAVREIENIVEKGRKAQQAIIELEGFLSANFDSKESTFSKDFKEQTQSELDGLKTLILDGQRAEEMLNNVGGNRSLLKNIADKLDGAGFGSASAVSLPSELLDIIKDYTNIDYNYSKPDKGDKKDDPRAGKADAVKEFIIERILKDVSYKTEGIDEKDLPSYTKVPTGSFDREDEGFIDDPLAGGGILATSAAEAVYGGNLGNIGDDIDLYNEEGMLQENALGFIADIGNLVAGGAVDLRDNIYLNEYIMGTFKNSVPVMKPGNENVKDTNLQGIEKDTLQTFYDSEVEYILHGNASQQLNSIMTKGELLMVRFGLDTLHVYTDGKKKAMAAGIATAVAGWWTGGAGIPIISNLIMCGWGMGEAVIDVKDLMDGKSIPIYKMTGDWKLDVGLPAASGPKTDKRLYFNYQDYLRVFLLTMNENKKLNRVEDLIQLNLGKSRSGFKMTECNTYVRVEAEVSMRYLFITQPFIQKAMKTNDGRYVFKVLVYEGY